ncbi:MAG: glyoxylase I family protein [Gammaproteobacteria bacterium]|jgi:glyoxylase I family protein
MNLDHAVLWVDSAKRALKFYVEVLGLEPVRTEAFENGTAPFPSVRLNETTIFDLMERRNLLSLQEFTGGGDNTGGAPINHLCLSMNASEFHEVSGRLEARGVNLKSGGEDIFGAQGLAVRSIYFNDPDGNVLEIRYYKEANPADVKNDKS